ncbi:MAG: ybhS, partial [Bacteroidetes bacterium]|nr:ybhS [Bacteroidota bacterium]
MNNTMKQLAAFLQKEFLHVFRDKRTLLVMFGLPIAQILIFGFA